MIDEKVRALFMAIIVLAWAIVAWTAQGATIFPTKYDAQISDAVERFWPEYRYPLAWKAELWVESRLDPNAVSPVGAAGLAQVMPGTWIQIERALGYGVISRSLAQPAIFGGAWYLETLRRQWAPTRAPDERHKLAVASYNSGSGNIIKAQKLCSDALLWADIAPCLVQVTGSANSAQTQNYVRDIWKWWNVMAY